MTFRGILLSSVNYYLLSHTPAVFQMSYPLGLVVILTTQVPNSRHSITHLLMLVPDSPVVSMITAFHAFTTGYGHLAAYNDIWIMWFSIPLIGGINKPIHCSTDESPFFQKLLLG